MPRTVLIIDDDANLQTVLEITLRQAGFDVQLASNGEEGLERLQTLQPNIVISDVMMPQMDGVQFFQAIRERLQYENIPIIVMTALTPKPWFRDLEMEGAVIVQKPFDVDQLVSLVQLHVED